MATPQELELPGLDGFSDFEEEPTTANQTVLDKDTRLLHQHETQSTPISMSTTGAKRQPKSALVKSKSTCLSNRLHSDAPVYGAGRHTTPTNGHKTRSHVCMEKSGNPCTSSGPHQSQPIHSAATNNFFQIKMN